MKCLSYITSVLQLIISVSGPWGQVLMSWNHLYCMALSGECCLIMHPSHSVLRLTGGGGALINIISSHIFHKSQICRIGADRKAAQGFVRTRAPGPLSVPWHRTSLHKFSLLFCILGSRGHSPFWGGWGIPLLSWKTQGIRPGWRAGHTKQSCSGSDYSHG